MADKEKPASRKAEWKKAKTLQMPTLIPPVLEEIRESLGRNEKQQWAVVTAAVLRLLDAPREVQALYVSEALMADTGPKGIAELIERTRGGHLRDAAAKRMEEAEARARPATPRLPVDRTRGRMEGRPNRGGGA